MPRPHATCSFTGQRERLQLLHAEYAPLDDLTITQSLAILSGRDSETDCESHDTEQVSQPQTSLSTPPEPPLAARQEHKPVQPVEPPQADQPSSDDSAKEEPSPPGPVCPRIDVTFRDESVFRLVQLHQEMNHFVHLNEAAYHLILIGLEAEGLHELQKPKKRAKR